MSKPSSSFVGARDTEEWEQFFQSVEGWKDVQRMSGAETKGRRIQISAALDYKRLTSFREVQHVASRDHSAETKFEVTNVDEVSIGNVCRQKDLTKMREISIKELKMGTVHRNCYLQVQMIEDIAKLSAVHTLVKDSDGNTISLSFYGLPAHVVDSKLKKGARMRVKNPYCKFIMEQNGGYNLRDDNPFYNLDILPPKRKGKRAAKVDTITDLTEEKSTDVRSTEELLAAATKWKERGNGCVSEKRFVDAAKCYRNALAQLRTVAEPSTASSSALRVDGAVELRLKARSNLVFALISARRNREAMLESKVAWDLSQTAEVAADSALFALRQKVAYRRCHALANSCRYKEALDFVDKVTARFGDSAEAKPRKKPFLQLKKRLATALKQTTMHIWSRKEIASSLYRRGTVQFKARFLHPSLRVKWISDAKGRGVVATEDIATHTPLVFEKAIVSHFADHSTHTVLEIRHTKGTANNETQAACVAKLRQQLYSIPIHERFRLSLLHFSEEKSAKKSAVRKWKKCVPRMDVFRFDELPKGITADKVPVVSAKRVLGIVSQNAFEVFEESRAVGSALSGTAVFVFCSLFNHSSDANCERNSIGDWMMLATSQPIKKDTELTISYQFDESKLSFWDIDDI